MSGESQESAISHFLDELLPHLVQRSPCGDGQPKISGLELWLVGRAPVMVLFFGVFFVVFINYAVRLYVQRNQFAEQKKRDNGGESAAKKVDS